MAVMAAQHTTVCLDNVSKGKFSIRSSCRTLFVHQIAIHMLILQL